MSSDENTSMLDGKFVNGSYSLPDDANSWTICAVSVVTVVLRSTIGSILTVVSTPKLCASRLAVVDLRRVKNKEMATRGEVLERIWAQRATASMEVLKTPLPVWFDTSDAFDDTSKSHCIELLDWFMNGPFERCKIGRKPRDELTRAGAMIFDSVRVGLPFFATEYTGKFIDVAAKKAVDFVLHASQPLHSAICELEAALRAHQLLDAADMIERALAPLTVLYPLRSVETVPSLSPSTLNGDTFHRVWDAVGGCGTRFDVASDTLPVSWACLEFHPESIVSALAPLRFVSQLMDTHGLQPRLAKLYFAWAQHVAPFFEAHLEYVPSLSANLHQCGRGDVIIHLPDAVTWIGSLWARIVGPDDVEQVI